MNTSRSALFAVLALAWAASTHAQGPAQPLPVSITLVPTSLGAQQAVGLQLGIYDWDMSVSLPRPASPQGFNLRAERALDDLNGRTGASVGAAWRTSLGRVGVSYRIDASPLAEANAARSLGLSYGYEFRSGLRLSTSLDRGLNEFGPRWGGGLTITYSH